MNLNSPGWATTIGSGCKGGAVNKPPINTSNTAICRHSNSPQKNRLQRVRASSCLNLWNTSSFLYHHFMSVDFHVGVPLRRGAPGLESSLPNKKRDISERQMAQLNTEPQCMRHSFWQQRECEEQNFKETHCKVPLFVLHGSSTGKASSGCTLSKGQVHHKPLPIKAPSGFPLMGSLVRFLSPPHQMQSSEQEWVSERGFSAQGEGCWGTLWLEGENLYCLPKMVTSRKLLG